MFRRNHGRVVVNFQNCLNALLHLGFEKYPEGNNNTCDNNVLLYNSLETIMYYYNSEVRIFHERLIA
jgi:hypothetical protein